MSDETLETTKLSEAISNKIITQQNRMIENYERIIEGQKNIIQEQIGIIERLKQLLKGE